MTARLLQIILGAALLLCSTPWAMAREGVASEGAAWEMRAAVAVEASGQTVSQDDEEIGEAESSAPFLANGMALLPNTQCEVESESESGGDNESKRSQKRPTPRARLFTRCRISHSLSPKSLARGVATHPESQDAGQERTAAVRFLHIQALVC